MDLFSVKKEFFMLKKSKEIEKLFIHSITVRQDDFWKHCKTIQRDLHRIKAHAWGSEYTFYESLD